MSLHRNESKEFKQGGRATDAPNSTFGPNASFQVHLRAGPPDGRETELPRMGFVCSFPLEGRAGDNVKMSRRDKGRESRSHRLSPGSQGLGSGPLSRAREPESLPWPAGHRGGNAATRARNGSPRPLATRSALRLPKRVLTSMLPTQSQTEGRKHGARLRRTRPWTSEPSPHTRPFSPHLSASANDPIQENWRLYFIFSQKEMFLPPAHGDEQGGGQRPRLRGSSSPRAWLPCAPASGGRSLPREQLPGALCCGGVAIWQ